MFTSRQMDAIKELVNIGVGKGAAALNKILKSHIRLLVPSFKLISSADLKKEIKVLGATQLMAVSMDFKGNFSGNAKLVFSEDSANQIYHLVSSDDKMIPNEETSKKEMLCEVGNIVISSVVGTISNMLDINMKYSLPHYEEAYLEQMSFDDPELPVPIIFLVRTDFNVEDMYFDGGIAIVFKEDSFQDLLCIIDKHISDTGGIQAKPFIESVRDS